MLPAPRIVQKQVVLTHLPAPADGRGVDILPRDKPEESLQSLLPLVRLTFSYS